MNPLVLVKAMAGGVVELLTGSQATTLNAAVAVSAEPGSSFLVAMGAPLTNLRHVIVGDQEVVAVGVVFHRMKRFPASIAVFGRVHPVAGTNQHFGMVCYPTKDFPGRERRRVLMHTRFSTNTRHPLERAGHL